MSSCFCLCIQQAIPLAQSRFGWGHHLLPMWRGAQALNKGSQQGAVGLGTKPTVLRVVVSKSPSMVSPHQLRHGAVEKCSQDLSTRRKKVGTLQKSLVTKIKSNPNEKHRPQAVTGSLFILYPLQIFMEHFTTRKGSSNFISSLQQAVNQVFLEPDSVDLETVLHWRGGSSAVCHGQE